MSEPKPTPDQDPQNPWGLNHLEFDTPTYRGVEIPVINETSSREDLLRYIRILEARLHLTHVYMARPKDMPEDVQDAGVCLPYDLPDFKPERPDIMKSRFVRVSQNQAERVQALARGVDRVGCLQAAEQFYRSAAQKTLPDDPEVTFDNDARL